MRSVKRNVALNQHGFVLQRGRGNNTKWNLYDDFFCGQVGLQDLNFMQRQFVIEVELVDPRTLDIFLLRYLTFNQLTQPVYPKIFITIMQHLRAKKRVLRMFDSLPNEILDFDKERSLLRRDKTRDGPNSLDVLFDKLVIKDANYPLVMKIKPKLECPPIRMRGIILESPKRKVQIKCLSEFISLTDGLFNRPKLQLPDPKPDHSPLSIIKDSRETLRNEYSNPASSLDSTYVAVPVINHELPAAKSQQSTQNKETKCPSKISSYINVGNKSPRNMNASPPKISGGLQKSMSRLIRKSPKNAQLANSMAADAKASPNQLNSESTSKIILDEQVRRGDHNLDPCMQVTRI